MRKLFIFISLFICLYSIINAQAFIENDKIIVVDPGHGGMDIGASIGDIYESDLVLEISYKIKEVLEKNGYMVILTRTNKDSLCSGKFIKKEDMNKRINIINNSNAKVSISIHLNKFNIERYKGAQVFYSSINDENKILAQTIQDSLKNYLNNTDRSIVKRDNIYLLNRVRISCCLIECGFMSNKEELVLLQDEKYQYKFAEAILMGVNNYLK